MSTDSSSDGLSAIIDDMVNAYNEKDFERLRGFLAPQFYFCHHNRTFEHNDADDFIETLKTFASNLVPDRKLSEPESVIESGNTVVRTHTWGGLATTDIPGIGADGELIEIQLCSIYVFEGNLVTEYHDYG